MIIMLTIFVSAKVGSGLRRWLRFSGFVHSNNAELVPLALAQSRHPSLQVLDGGDAVRIVRNQGVKPAAELVLLLNDVM